MADGAHVITAALDLAGGGTEVVSATFTVANSGPILAWSPDPVTLNVPEGGSTTTQVNLNTASGTAAFTLTETASWLTVSPTTGSTPASVTLTIDAAGLAAGTYTTVVTASAPGYVSDGLIRQFDGGGSRRMSAGPVLLRSWSRCRMSWSSIRTTGRSSTVPASGPASPTSTGLRGAWGTLPPTSRSTPSPARSGS